MELFYRTAVNLADAVEKLIWLALIFLVLAVLVKGRAVFRADRIKLPEIRVNLVYLLMDAAILAPLLGLFSGGIVAAVHAQNLTFVSAEVWASMPWWLVFLLAVWVSDFVGYWRHRLMHCAVLWPVHAIHHSDTALNWLSLVRFHPINRLISVALSTIAFSALGFPPWAAFANALLRNWYGYFIHADLPWSYGPVVGRIFVSPVMHRWHHVRDVTLSGNNFATIFAFHDRVFGTWHCPSKDVGDLGIDDYGFPLSWAGQIVWPFRVWLGLAPKSKDIQISS